MDNILIYQYKSDNEIVKDIQNDKNSDLALEELSNRHSALYINVVQKYLPALINSGVCNIEIFNDKHLTLYNSAKTFDESRNCKFSTHLANTTRFICLNLLNHNKSVAVDQSQINYFIDKTNFTYNTPIEEKNEIKQNINLVFEILDKINDKRVKKVFEIRYFTKENKNLKWAEIAKKMNLSTQTLIKLYNKGKKEIIKVFKHKNSEFLSSILDLDIIEKEIY